MFRKKKEAGTSAKGESGAKAHKPGKTKASTRAAPAKPSAGETKARSTAKSPAVDSASSASKLAKPKQAKGREADRPATPKLLHKMQDDLDESSPSGLSTMVKHAGRFSQDGQAEHNDEEAVARYVDATDVSPVRRQSEASATEEDLEAMESQLQSMMELIARAKQMGIEDPSMQETVDNLKNAIKEQRELVSEYNEQQYAVREGEARLEMLMSKKQMHEQFARNMEEYENARVSIPDSQVERRHQGVDAPSGIVTLVFTDIMDSTKLWESQPKDMERALTLHADHMREAINEFNGYEVKTEGDAFMIAFWSSEDALRFSLHVQVSLLHLPWPEDLLREESAKLVGPPEKPLFRGLRIKISVYEGEPIPKFDRMTNRMDYFGPVVNRAARLCGAARGGQTVLSKSLVDRLRLKFGRSLDALGSPLVLDMGKHVLKGIREKEHLYCLLPKCVAVRAQPRV